MENQKYYLIDNYTMKCRLYPNSTAAKAIDEAIDGVRLAFNNALYDCVNNGRNLRETEKGYHYVDFAKIAKADYLNELRKQDSRIDKAPASSLSGKSGCFRSDMVRMLAHRKTEYIVKNDGTRIKKKCKNKINVDKKTGQVKDLPIELAQINYYSKNKRRTSYTFQMKLNTTISVKHDVEGGKDYVNRNVFYITLPKIRDEDGKLIPIKVRGWNKDIRFGENQDKDFLEFVKDFDKAVTVTVSKDNCGDYWICFKLGKVAYKLCTEQDKDNAVGVDVGIKDVAILSDGTKYKNKKFLKSELEHKRSLSRQLSRRSGMSNIKFREAHKVDKTLQQSKRYEKTQRKLAKLDRKISWQRKNNNDNISYDIVAQNSFIGVESLNVSGMFRNRHLARSLSDVAIGQLLQMLQYKSKWYGRIEQPIDMWTPSSKECNVCGYINKGLTLADRFWKCPVCGTYHDRDINAAKNIKKYALITYEQNKH